MRFRGQALQIHSKITARLIGSLAVEARKRGELVELRELTINFEYYVIHIMKRDKI